MTASTSDSPSKRPNLPESWLFAIEDEFATQQTRALKTFLIKERAQHTVYPPGRDMFNAFWLTPFEAVRVVILGQDPYHGPNQAHGLCFSVRKEVRPPPSLQNIFKELHRDCGIEMPRHGDLSSWAQQGVLLLNTVLSVRAHQANSHRGQGWEQITDRVIAELNQRHTGVVFVLWGSAAGRKAQMIDGRKHSILRVPHPSPLSAHRGLWLWPFLHNEHMARQGLPCIDWSLPA